MSSDALINVVERNKPFQYFHDGAWKVGYYDPVGRIMVATQDNVVLTIMEKVPLRYVYGLIARVP
jgi:hypothetical protein